MLLCYIAREYIKLTLKPQISSLKIGSLIDYTTGSQTPHSSHTVSQDKSNCAESRSIMTTDYTVYDHDLKPCGVHYTALCWSNCKKWPRGKTPRTPDSQCACALKCGNKVGMGTGVKLILVPDWSETHIYNHQYLNVIHSFN